MCCAEKVLFRGGARKEASVAFLLKLWLLLRSWLAHQAEAKASEWLWDSVSSETKGREACSNCFILWRGIMVAQSLHLTKLTAAQCASDLYCQMELAWFFLFLVFSSKIPICGAPRNLVFYFLHVPNAVEFSMITSNQISWIPKPAFWSMTIRLLNICYFSVTLFYKQKENCLQR